MDRPPCAAVTIDALRRTLLAALAAPPASPTVITVGGAPTAALLPYGQAAALAAERGMLIPAFGPQAGTDLLLDLVLRADALHCPSAITYGGTAAVAIVPLDWPPAPEAGTPTAPEGITQ